MLSTKQIDNSIMLVACFLVVQPIYILRFPLEQTHSFRPSLFGCKKDALLAPCLACYSLYGCV